MLLKNNTTRKREIFDRFFCGKTTGEAEGGLLLPHFLRNVTFEKLR
jgi:hypothetical protein